MRTGHWAVAAVLAAGLVCVAAADEPRQPGATGVFVPGPGRDLGIAVLDTKQLQDELKLTAEQQQKLKPVAEAHAAALKKRRADREITAEYEAAQAEAKKAVEQTLTPDQLKRLTQIERQAAGVYALWDETTCKALDLSAEQYPKVATVIEKFRTDSRRQPGERFTAERERVEKLRKAAVAELVGVLTDAQKKTWKELVGEPFDTGRITFQPIATPFSVGLMRSASRKDG